MTAKDVKPTRQPQEHDASSTGPPLIDQDTPPPSKDPSQGATPAETGQPGGGRGRVDVTGIMPAGIRVDPDLTEGHPGYEESGDSEIIPPERLAGGGSAAEKGKAG